MTPAEKEALRAFVEAEWESIRLLVHTHPHQANWERLTALTEAREKLLAALEESEAQGE